MKKIIKYFKDIWLQISDALVTVASPLSKWVELATTVNVLRRQFSDVTSPKYADALSAVIEQLSAGSFESKRDLWLVAIKDVRNGIDPVEIVYKFDLAAFDTDGYFDLMFRSKGN